MQPAESTACWGELTRTACCYGGNISCFDETYTFERCCVARESTVGPQAFVGFIQPEDEEFPRSLAQLKLGGGAALVARSLRTALQGLSKMENDTIAGVDRDLRMESAWHFITLYYVSLEALRKKLSLSLRMGLVRREAQMWKSLGVLTRHLWGYADFCRCLEAAEFYSWVRHRFWTSGVPRRNFVARLFNQSREPHFVPDAKTCWQTDLELTRLPSMFSQAYISGCLPGDIAQFIMHSQECLLEHELEKTLHMLHSLMHLVTLTSDCLDTDYWGFSTRDIAVEMAKGIWEVARRDDEQIISLSKSFLGRFAWSPHRGVESERIYSQVSWPGWVPGQPWHVQCGPHLVNGPVEVLQTAGRGALEPKFQGPLCTESGRFWLSVGFRPVDEGDRTLLIIPITYVSWSNPWHHMHWWLPAIDLKMRMGLANEDVDVALVFPSEDSDFGGAAKQKLNTSAPLQRSERVHWSFLKHTWPQTLDKKPIKHLRAWKRGGLHEDVLRWLSARPARQLREYYGQHYQRVILGLRPLRFQAASCSFHCDELQAIKTWIRQTPEYLAPRSREELAVLQRPWAAGRAILNLDEVTLKLRQRFSQKLHVSVIEKIETLSWLRQFQRFEAVRILAGVHGAGLAWLWTMRPGGAVIEFRPRGAPPFQLSCRERWNEDGAEIFGGWARLSRLHHICLRQGPSHLQEEDFEDWDRDANLTLQPDRVKLIVQEALALVEAEPRGCDETF